MSFRAFLDRIEKRAGKVPAELVAEAQARGYGADIMAGEVIRLAGPDGLGRGQAMALVHVIKNGPGVSHKHVGTDGVGNR